MNHETSREHVALRLYGELDAEESRQLDAHLADCPDCRRFAAEMERSLGRLVPAVGDDLPAGWERSLARQTTGTSRRIAAWFPVAASFAAGALLVAGLGAPRSEPDARDDVAVAPAFHVAEPPPPALRRGPTLLGIVLRR